MSPKQAEVVIDRAVSAYLEAFISTTSAYLEALCIIYFCLFRSSEPLNKHRWLYREFLNKQVDIYRASK